MKRRSRKVVRAAALIALAVAFALPVRTASADSGSIVINGDFEVPPIAASFATFSWMPPESGFDSWRVDDGSVDLVRDLWTAASGAQSIDLNGECCEPGVMSQDLPTEPGVTYTLSFAFAGNPDPAPICPGTSPPIKQMEVLWGGTSAGVFSFDIAGHTLAEPGWRWISVPLTATDTTTTLRFASLIRGACGPALDDVDVRARALRVPIDIKPGSARNPIKLSAHGLIPVAILSMSSFDATTIDPATVCFGDAEEPSQRDCTEAHGKGHVENVNGDGKADLLLHFEVAEAGIDAGDKSACLTGATIDGTPITGCDGITPL